MTPTAGGGKKSKFFVPVPGTRKQKTAKISRSRLSQLSLLNLLGLIEIGKLAAHMRTHQADGIDQAIEIITNASDFLAKIALHSDGGISTSQIATCQILEELKDNLFKIIAFREAQEDHILPTSASHLAHLGLNKDSIQFLLSHINGDCIIYSREFV